MATLSCAGMSKHPARHLPIHGWSQPDQIELLRLTRWQPRRSRRLKTKPNLGDGRQPRSLTPEKLLEHSRLPHDPLIVPGKHRFTARSSWRTPRRRRATSDSSSRPGWSIMMPRSEKSIRMSTKDGTSNNDRASSLLQKINFSS